MVSLFSAPRIPRNPHDEVVPLHFFDDTIIWRSFILYSTFVFDCVLDADKLRSSLERLVCCEGWWKLGARLRKSVRSKTLIYNPVLTPKTAQWQFRISYSENLH